MSLLDSVISFFAMVKQSSFACLGQGHALTPRRVQPVPVFSFHLRVLSWACARTSEHAELLREVATHLSAHDESSTTGVAAPQSQASLG